MSLNLSNEKLRRIIIEYRLPLDTETPDLSADVGKEEEDARDDLEGVDILEESHDELITVSAVVPLNATFGELAQFAEENADTLSGVEGATVFSVGLDPEEDAVFVAVRHMH